MVGFGGRYRSRLAVGLVVPTVMRAASHVLLPVSF